MNQALKDIWKKNFPLWPDILIKKFSDQIEIESNYFDKQFGAAQQAFYSASVPTKKDFAFGRPWGDYNFGVAILNPTNPKFKSNAYFDFGQKFPYKYAVPGAPFTGDKIFGLDSYPTPMVAGSSLAFDYGPNYFYTHAFGNVYFDARIYENIGSVYNQIVTGTGDRIQVFDGWLYEQWAGVTNVNYLLQCSATAKKYTQSDSLIALHENGIDMPGIDYAKLYEFNTYVKSYQNFAAQIQGSVDVAKKTAAADLQNYKSDLDSKLMAQKNSLQNLTLQLTSQTAAQADSAKRDMQQLALQVASIKIQVLGMLK